MLRRIAQLLKLWRNVHSQLRLNSFFMELLLIEEKICRPGRSYGHSLLRGLSVLAQRRFASLDDPLSISGKIFSAATVLQREEIRRVAASSRELAKAALRYEAENDLEEADRCWQDILGYKVY
jgi:hypothetical protein